MSEEHSSTISFTVDRRLFLGLFLGIVIGVVGAVSGVKILERLRSDGAMRTFATAPALQEKDTPAVPAQLTITKDDHIRGNKDAPVVLVEFSDFQCPFCRRHHSTMKNILSQYGTRVAWVYKHLPLSSHAQAMPAALASECAAEQGKFWEYADLMLERQEELTSAPVVFKDLAKDVGLKLSSFQTCFQSQKYHDKIINNQQEGERNGAHGTPATFVNGVFVSGAVPENELTRLIDKELAARS